LAVFQINLKNVDVFVQDQVLTQFQFSDNMKNSSGRMALPRPDPYTVAKNIAKTRILKGLVQNMDCKKK
jgi:hypothetical protein